MTRRFAAWIVDHPFWVIGVILSFTALFAGAIPSIRFEQDFEAFLPQDDPAVIALQRAEERYGDQKLFMVAIETDDTIFKPSTLTKIKEMEELFEQIPEVDEVRGPTNSQVIHGTETAITISVALPEIPTTPEELEAYKERVLEDRLLRGFVISEDGKAAGVLIRLKPAAAETVDVVNRVLEIAERYQGPERIYVGGMPRFNQFIAESMRKDLTVLFPVIALVIVMVLYLSFNSWRGIVLPLATVILSAIWEVGTMGFLGAPFTPFSFIAPIVLMAVGTAYGIHILNKYYEEAQNHRRSRREILIETISKMLSPTAMAALTTLAGFLALLSSTLWPQRDFGVYTGIGVVYAALLALTFIPAVLARLPLPRSERRSLLARWLQGGAGLPGLTRFIERAPVAILVVAALAASGWAVGLPRLRIETSVKEFLGKGHPVTEALDVLERHFGGSLRTAIEIDLGMRDGLKEPAVLKKILALQEFLETLPGVHRTMSITNLVRELHQKFHADDPNYYMIPDDRKLISQLLLLFTFQGGSLGQMALTDFSAGEVLISMEWISSTQMSKLVAEIQKYLDERFGPTATASALLTSDGSPIQIEAEQVGTVPVYARLMEQIRENQIWSLLTSVSASWLIVSLLMGSVIAGLLCIVPLVLTILTEFGLMAYLDLPLDMSTMMIGSIAIGIGIDYAIHFIERYRHEFAQDGERRRALEQTLARTGAGIGYNALALTLGFGVLWLSTFKGLNIFGSLVALTMVVSALSTFTVIPAILLLWRPGFLKNRRIHGRPTPT
ncbi:MMPL family transporter [Candidatus Acetothermia bacterium]|jgi:predicted RND superfamily exporter protein|nr:MMPL family transporter [Candidatus Acetothermia bacterium]MCI2432645.1 MMPL family transporter [Candidatus Acetothermia bacterium]MCI2435929.1 MMPL family transporter [Candidatus Acetothermia bacterium]